MNPTIVKACVQDQHLQLVNEPFIASGGVDVIQIQFEFCGLWTGCGKTAVFYRDPAKVYPVPILDDLATVPHEVMAEEGFFYFGVMGADGKVRTTEVVKVKVVRGAVITEPAEPEDLTVYQQMMARWSEAIAMRSNEGATVYEYEEESLAPYDLQPSSMATMTGTLKTNGASVAVNLFIDKLSIATSGYISIPLPDTLVPIQTTELTYEVLEGSDTFTCKCRVYHINGQNVLNIKNTGPASGPGYSSRMQIQGVFALTSISIAELVDVRVAADGTTYPTAGDAVRAIEGKIPSSVHRDDGSRYTHIGDKTVEIAAGDNDEAVIELTERGIDIYSSEGVSISNVVDPIQDDDAANKKYVDDKVKNLQPGGGGGDPAPSRFMAEYGVTLFEDIEAAYNAGMEVKVVYSTTLVGCLVIASLRESEYANNYFQFEVVDSNGMLRYIKCNREEVWSVFNSPYTTPAYVDGKVSSIELVKIVTELPAEGVENKTYFVPKTDGEGNDLYDEYMWVNGAWEYIGTKQFDIDLTDYVKNTDFASADVAGVVKVGNGLTVNPKSNALGIVGATEPQIAEKLSNQQAITPQRLDYAVKTGVTTNAIELTDEEKAAALAWLGAVGATDFPDPKMATAGVIKIDQYYGFTLGQYGSAGVLMPVWASNAEIDAKTDRRFINAKNFDYALEKALATSAYIAQLEARIAALEG